MQAAYVYLIETFPSETAYYIMFQSAFVWLFTPDTMLCINVWH